MLIEVVISVRDGQSQGVPEGLSVTRELVSFFLELVTHKLVGANNYSVHL